MMATATVHKATSLTDDAENVGATAAAESTTEPTPEAGREPYVEHAAARDAVREEQSLAVGPDPGEQVRRIPGRPGG